MPSRDEGLTAFYAANAHTLWRTLRGTISGPDALIDDACAEAWAALLRHPTVALDDRGFGWLYVVGWRHAVRLSDKGRREVAVGEIAQPADNDCALSPDEELERRERLALLCELPGRQRRMVLMHAAGFTYEEISRMTGDTLRTVERQLLRGKRALRRLDHQSAA